MSGHTQQRSVNHVQDCSRPLSSTRVCVCFLIPCVAGIHDPYESWLGRFLLFVDAACGVVIAMLVSLFVFPVRARVLLKRSMATSLERMANLAFDVLGELCQVGGYPLLLACIHPEQAHSRHAASWVMCNLSAACRS